MKTIKYTTIAAMLTLGLAACTNNSRNNATLGGTQDTTDVRAGSNAGGVNAADQGDTSQHGNKNGRKDSTADGNANPTGHLENDTVNQNKNHKPQ